MTKPKRVRTGINFDLNLKWKLKELSAKKHEHMTDLVNRWLWDRVNIETKKGKKTK